MNTFKHTLKIAVLILFISLSSCNDKYPDLGDGLYAEIITSKGTMVARLTFDKTPLTVANFVALAEGVHPMVDSAFVGKKYYNGLIFHRVMDKFMIQGGDPTGTGSGHPGYKFGSEFDKTLKHDKPGILSMANSGGLNTNGSQFFIMEVPYPSLDFIDAQGNLKNCDQPRVSCHSVFGELVLGLEIQDSISNVKVGPGNRPEQDVVIEEVNIIRQGYDARNFDAVTVWETELPKLEEKKKQREEEARVKAQEAQEALREKAEVSKQAFIKENENLKGRVVNFPTGLVMIYTHESNGAKPSSQDKVLINCSGYFEDGQLFYTTVKEVAIAKNEFDENQDKAGAYKPFPMIYNESASLVPGFREAMLNMNVGDKTRVFIPSFLGYGERGRAPRIPPNTNLVFDLEIVSLDK